MGISETIIHCLMRHDNKSNTRGMGRNPLPLVVYTDYFKRNKI